MDQCPEELAIKFGKSIKRYPIIKKPYPHILVDSKKELHGWWDSKEPYGRRECTAERLLINPYNGCSHDCFFCYAHALWGYFKEFKKNKVVTVFQDFDKIIERQLDQLNVVSCGYISAVTDPFQPLESKYHLSQKIIESFINKNIPVDFITKGKVPTKVLDLMSEQKHSFGQVSILTPDEEKRRLLVKGDGATTEILFKNIENMNDRGIYPVCRIDPIFPYFTDSETELRTLVERASEAGAKHIIASVVDVPPSLEKSILDELRLIDPDLSQKYRKLYNERIGYDKNADINYRRGIFNVIRALCNENGLTFALCMEFEIMGKAKGGKQILRGLNKDYMTSRNCEGIDTPVYKRKGAKFYPVDRCKGNCLTCISLSCGIPELQKASNWKLKDYKRWSKPVTPSANLDNF